MNWNYRQTKRRISWLKLSLLLLGIVGAGGGVSFAALISQQAKLAGNTIQTATANLQISGDGTNFSNTQPGFVFSNLVPGAQASPASGYPIYLKNTGGTPLALQIAISSLPTNPDSIDLSKVHVILAPTSGGSVQNLTIQSLIGSYPSGGQSILSPALLMPGTTAQYKLQIMMDADAVNGPSASINNVDFSFGGVATGS